VPATATAPEYTAQPFNQSNPNTPGRDVEMGAQPGTGAQPLRLLPNMPGYDSAEHGTQMDVGLWLGCWAVVVA
jgi:hypothetical protein